MKLNYWSLQQKTYKYNTQIADFSFKGTVYVDLSHAFMTLVDNLHSTPSTSAAGALGERYL